MARWMSGVALLASLSACSPVKILNALAPRAGITETRDIRYSLGNRHELDVYTPNSEASAPVIVFIYGGGWKAGNRDEYQFVATALAARGYLTVVPDYRLFPQVRFPEFLQDAAAAVAWTRTNISRYGGDPHRIFLMGHSAGAYIVAMLTLDKQWLAADGMDPDHDIIGTIGLAGPYDFLPLHDPELEAIFAPAKDLTKTQPITFVRQGAPPMFLAAGTRDTTVRPQNTEALAEALQRDGVLVDQQIYPGVNHVEIIGAMAGVLRWLAPVVRDVSAFIDRYANGTAEQQGAPSGEMEPPFPMMRRTACDSGQMDGATARCPQTRRRL